MLEELLLPDLREAVVERDWQTLSEFCSIFHPSIIARTLAESNDPELIWSAFTQIDPPRRTLIFEYLPEEIQDKLVSRLPRPELASLLELMSHDDRVDLVKRMDDDRQSRIIPLVARADREDILRLASFEEGTAGSITTTDYVALSADWTVDEALQRVRREAPDRETIYYLYVVDGDRHLLGFISLKDLIIAIAGRKVRDVMREDVLFVSALTDVEQVAATLARYDLLAIPVVDSDQRLLGIITHDDVIDVLVEEATEDAHRMGAVQPLDAHYFDSPFWATIRKRVVWLALLFCAEMLTSVVLDSYEDLLHTFTLLVVFMPVITATGGNSGSQSATLITRGLALGHVMPRDWWRVVWRELFSGIVLGLAVGCLGVATVPTLFNGSLVYSIVLMTAIVSVTTCGSLVGSIMPLVFKRVGLDPAISSTPFVASTVDVLGIYIYCSIASRLLK